MRACRYSRLAPTCFAKWMAQAEVSDDALTHIVKNFLAIYKYTFRVFPHPGRVFSLLSLICTLTMGASVAKRPFPYGPKTTFSMLAMVISIVMTIATTLKTDLGRTENEGEKGANNHYFANGYYFLAIFRCPKVAPTASKIAIAC